MTARIAVASGKGGTGKTLVAVSLALAAAKHTEAALLDADVEAPNAALFLDVQWQQHVEVQRLVPVVEQALCTHCGRCAEVCQYHAIAALPKKTLVFADVCHSCGSCAVQCPAGAIREEPVTVGALDSGRHSERLALAQGTLQISQAMAPPVIRALKQHARTQGWDAYPVTVIDAPPGASCPMVEALRGADAVLLVTEPTPFGLHDLALAADVARGVLGLPVAVVLNKSGTEDAEAEAYCRAHHLPILLRIPLERRIAEAYSEGIPLVTAQPAYLARFERLLADVAALAGEALQ